MKNVELDLDEELEEYLVSEYKSNKQGQIFYIFELPNMIIIEVANHPEEKQNLWYMKVKDEDTAIYEKISELEVYYLLNNMIWDSLEEMDREIIYYSEGRGVVIDYFDKGDD